MYYFLASLCAIIALLLWYAYNSLYCLCLSNALLQRGTLLLDQSDAIYASSGSTNEIRRRCECCSCFVCFGTRDELINTQCVYVCDANRVKYKSTGETDQINKSVFNNTCMICLEDFTPEACIVSLSCHHGYHSACLKDWVLGKDDSCCPLCFQTIRSQTLTIGRADSWQTNTSSSYSDDSFHYSSSV